jgi:DNA-binding NarL/FixJ family response regulator
MSCILLYEKDEFISKELIQIIQNSFSHVDIKIVLSCEECLAELRGSTPDILMLGSNVADCNGFNLIGQTRKMHPGVCIILVTDYNIDEYRKDAILRGASHIISKELWTGNEIVALIKTILITKENQLHNKAEGPSIEIEDDTLERFS